MLSKKQKRLYIGASRGNQYKLVFVGESEESSLLKTYFIEKDTRLVVSGIFSDTKTNDLYLGKILDLYDYVIGNHVDCVICSIEQINRDEYNRLIDFCEINNIHLYVIPEKNYTPNHHHLSVIIKDIQLFRLLKSPLYKKRNAILKRIFDLIFSLLVCVLILSWLLPIIALLIKIESKGPVFFVQKRNGANNKEFNCLKFRTLHVNDDAHIKQVTKDDKRITKVGRFLRKTSLDEFPQFFNVLIGDMSTVGPRPHMIKHNEYYNNLIDKYIIRHYVKPGITGLAQILGYRGETESDIHLMKMRVRMDRFYIYNWSFWLDMKIIFKTFFEVFLPKKNTF